VVEPRVNRQGCHRFGESKVKRGVGRLGEGPAGRREGPPRMATSPDAPNGTCPTTDTALAVMQVVAPAADRSSERHPRSGGRLRVTRPIRIQWSAPASNVSAAWHTGIRGVLSPRARSEIGLSDRPPRNRVELVAHLGRKRRASCRGLKQGCWPCEPARVHAPRKRLEVCRCNAQGERGATKAPRKNGHSR